MQESSVYQDITRRARAEGIEFRDESEHDRGHSRTLRDSFSSHRNSIQPALEAIDDLQRLKVLRREAAETQTLEAFIRQLDDGR